MLDGGCKIPDIYCWLFDHECLDWRVAIDILSMVLNVKKWLRKKNCEPEGVIFFQNKA